MKFEVGDDFSKILFGDDSETPQGCYDCNAMTKHFS